MITADPGENTRRSVAKKAANACRFRRDMITTTAASKPSPARIIQPAGGRYPRKVVKRGGGMGERETGANRDGGARNSLS